jgi:glutathione S-transferase
MTNEFYTAAFITILVTLLTQAAQVSVSRARRKFGVPLPNVTGHVEFERFHRAHANQIEQNVVFLPILWLSSVVLNWVFILLLGLAWLALRVLYIRGYVTNNVQLRRFGGYGYAVPMMILLALTFLSIGISFFGIKF